MSHDQEYKDTDATVVSDNSSQVHLTGEKSPGVARIEALSAHLTTFDRVFLFIGVFLIAYAYSLDGTLRYTYQPYALAGYELHSLLATVNVVRTVIAAAAQPTAAKIADVFGRVELILVSIFFYVIGTIVEATANGVGAFCAGAILYQIGYTCVILLVEVIIADITSLRSRLFFSYIPATPFLINTWVSGDVGSAVLGTTTWKWGIGMWCIIYPVCALPLMLALFLAHRRAKNSANLADYKSPYQMLGLKRLTVALFWQLDVVGIILLIAVFGLILVPFTLAGGVESQWRSAHVIAPLVVGIICVPAFIFWERWCPHPLVPFHLLFPYTAQASIQAATKHEHVAVITGLYLASYQIGSALGNTISGAIWTQILPGELETRLAPFGNATAATAAYGNPFGYIVEWPVGTPERQAVVDAYRHAQRLLCITGICLCVPLIAFALVLRNPKLGKEQSLPDAEKRIAGEAFVGAEKKWWQKIF